MLHAALSFLRIGRTLIANRARARFTRTLIEQLSDVRVLVQTGNHASHIDFAAARDCGNTKHGYAHGGRSASVLRSSPSAHSAIAAARRGSAPA